MNFEVEQHPKTKQGKKKKKKEKIRRAALYDERLNSRRKKNGHDVGLGTEWQYNPRYLKALKFGVCLKKEMY